MPMQKRPHPLLDADDGHVQEEEAAAVAGAAGSGTEVGSAGVQRAANRWTASKILPTSTPPAMAPPPTARAAPIPSPTAAAPPPVPAPPQDRNRRRRAGPSPAAAAPSPTVPAVDATASPVAALLHPDLVAARLCFAGEPPAAALLLPLPLAACCHLCRWLLLPATAAACCFLLLLLLATCCCYLRLVSSGFRWID